MEVFFSILFVVAIIVTILVLCAWLMLYASYDYYPEIKDL